MSVAQLSARELGLFVAIQIKLELCESSNLGKLCEFAEIISLGNAEAWKATYSDEIETASVDDIEREALQYLADKTGRIAREHFGPLAYNCISNNGSAFLGHRKLEDSHKAAFAALRDVEEHCSKWQEGERSRIQKQEENDKAYVDFQPLPMKSGKEIKELCESLGYSRVIVAEYNVCENDIYTDYFGHRTARRVVIGFGKGKRENFKQLREAAANFEPTKSLGPGCDRWTAQVVFADDAKDRCHHFYKGQKSHWHNNLNDDNAIFTTEAAAREYAKQCGEPGSIILETGQEPTKFEWAFRCESIENRENYSMGGGNYLGLWRHNTGWKVRSGWIGDSDKVELLDIDHKPAKTTKPSKTKTVEVELIEQETHELDNGKSVYLTLQHNKTKALIGCHYSNKGKTWYSCSTGRARVGKSYWNFEQLRRCYRSKAMQAIIDYAEKFFEDEQPEAPKQEQQPGLSEEVTVPDDQKQESTADTWIDWL